MKEIVEINQILDRIELNMDSMIMKLKELDRRLVKVRKRGFLNRLLFGRSPSGSERK